MTTRKIGFVQRDEYIDSFFKNIKSQLSEATIEDKGRSVRYKDFVVAAQWSNELWDVQLNSSEESSQRFYDPTKASSPEAAACYFVDALRRLAGEEPFIRPKLMRGPMRRVPEKRTT